MSSDFISDRLREAAELHAGLTVLAPQIAGAADKIAAALRSGKTLYLFGNGGSAADAQHLAAELVVRLRRQRPAYAAAALTTDSSILTAAANDFSFNEIFARQVEALGRPGDALIGISTSGESANVYRAVETANERGLLTIGLLGTSGGKIAGLVQHALIVNEQDTQRVQECHILIGHIWMEMIDAALEAA